MIYNNMWIILKIVLNVLKKYIRWKSFLFKKGYALVYFWEEYNHKHQLKYNLWVELSNYQKNKGFSAWNSFQD